MSHRTIQTRALALKARASDAGINIHALAERVGISPATIYRWANGETHKFNTGGLKACEDEMDREEQRQNEARQLKKKQKASAK